MSHCRRCNRFLIREPWKSKGIGKICAGKELIEKAIASQDIICPYDGGDIFIERKGQLGIDPMSCSGIRTNIQRTMTYHSPDGFNFGYGGSGPAEAALNILLMFTDEKTAMHLHQDFKWKYLAKDGTRVVIPKSEILSFIEKQKRIMKMAHEELKYGHRAWE